MSNLIISPKVKVRLVADLSAAAFYTHQDKELALWHCLRALNTTGTGYIYNEMAIEGLRGVFGYSSRTIKRLLSSGEGIFWAQIQAKRGRVIKIYGLKKVCLMFSTCLLGDIHFFEVPAEKFRTLKARRLALWGSVAKPKHVKANPISRAALEDKTGIQRRRQQRYDSSPDKLVLKTAAFRPGCEHPRLPNIYHRKGNDTVHKGMLVKTRQFLKSLIADEVVEKRRYFTSARQMLRNQHRVDLCYILVRSAERRIKGRIEYQPILTMGGI